MSPNVENPDENASGIDGADDPFAPREGKTLTWSNVDMMLVSTGVSQYK